MLAHFLRGCSTCRRVLAPLAQALFEPAPAEAPDDGWRYELVVRRAIRRAFPDPPGASGAEPLAAGRLLQMPQPGWCRAVEQFKRCEAALEETRKLGRSDPQSMLALAIANATLAEYLDPASFAPGAAYDLQAKAYAELGNARRITDDFLRAESDLMHAAVRARMGTGDPMLLAEIVAMAASNCRATRRFGEAFLLLDQAYKTYRSLGENHFAGRTLIHKGIAKIAQGDLSKAMNLLQRGLRLVDRDREPALLLAGVHNLIFVQVDRALYSQGRLLIRRYHELYRRYGERFDLLRLRWLEGRIAAGLDEAIEAETALLEARAGFAEHRLAYVEALISLDLAILLQREGRKNEVGVLVEEMLSTFHALGIRREALAVHLMTNRRRPPKRLTPALLRSAAAKLQQLERGTES